LPHEAAAVAPFSCGACNLLIDWLERIKPLPHMITRTRADEASETSAPRHGPAARAAEDFFPLRFTAYLLGVGATFQVIVLLTGHYGWKRMMIEFGVLETAQVVVNTITIAGFLHLALRTNKSSGIYLLLGSLLLIGTIREFNNTPWYDNILPPTPVKAALSALLLLVIAVCYRRTLLDSARELVTRPAFFCFVLGAAVVCCWAQLLTQRALLERTADRAVEESLELGGYLLLLFGMVEEHLALRRNVAAAAESSRGA